MRRHFTAAFATILAALGLAAGLFAFPAHADGPTWNIGSLPDGYTIGGLGQLDAYGAQCVHYYVITGYGQTATIGYGNPAQGFGDCNPDFQAQLDAFVNASYVAPPVTTVETIPAAAAPTTTTVAPDAITPTVTVTVTDSTVDAKLAALQAQLDALSKRVDAVAQANTASWDAFIAATNGGASATDAALAARSAGLNALYQL